MPFTPTHIVAVLPFWPLRRVVPFSAFAIGAMIPDVPLFFPVFNYTQAHSTLGLISICLPLGMAVFFLFEYVMRKPMIAILPAYLASRLSSKPNTPKQAFLSTQLRYIIVVAFAIVVGACTHQIWDAFTHTGRWGTQLIPMLNSSISMGRVNMLGYKVFQHGSTFIGLPLLITLAAIELNRTIPRFYQGTLSVKWKLLAAALIFIIPVLVAIHVYMVSPNLNQCYF
ncbi:MAG: DUF4184 family protein [Cyanobacteria bacterium P01_C01_bin.118]